MKKKGIDSIIGAGNAGLFQITNKVENEDGTIHYDFAWNKEFEDFYKTKTKSKDVVYEKIQKFCLKLLKKRKDRSLEEGITIRELKAEKCRRFYKVYKSL